MNTSIANRASLGCLLALCAASAPAETVTLDALDDFADITAGEVPFYREPERGTLAVDAAIEAYRGRFARAVTTFAGEGGTYDVTFETLGEVDGDGVYRLLVDDVVAATATNAPSDDDFAPQRHLFDDIVIDAGAEIGVEAMATTNESVPENGGWAYARGRWRTLTFVTDAASEGEPSAGNSGASLGLSIGARVDDANPLPGEALGLDVTLGNTAGDTVATAPFVRVVLPPSLGFVASGGASCEPTASTASGPSGTLRCELAELGPGESATVSLRLQALYDSDAARIGLVAGRDAVNDEGPQASLDVTIGPVPPATDGTGTAGEEATGTPTDTDGDTVTDTPDDTAAEIESQGGVGAFGTDGEDGDTDGVSTDDPDGGPSGDSGGGAPSIPLVLGLLGAWLARRRPAA